MLFPLSLALAFLWQDPQVPVKPTPDKVLAKVNGVPLTAAEIEPYLWDWRANEVVEDFVLLNIAEQAAKKAGISVTPQELDERVKKELAQLQAGSYDAQKLRDQGFPMSRISLKIRTALLLEKLTLVSFKAEEWAQIGTVEFKAEGTALMTWGKVAHDANQFYSRIQKGALWEKIKPQDSQPDRWLPLASLSADLAAKAKTASPGTVFPPRQNGQSLEVMRLVASGGKLSPAALIDLKAFYIQQNRQATLNKLREEAKVERTP